MENNNKGAKTFFYVILVLVVALVVFVLVRKNKNKGMDEFDIGRANVETVDVMLLESFPVQVNVIAKGTLPDGCTEIGDNQQQLVGNTFQVVLETKKSKDGDIMCTQALEDFSTTIALKNVVGISAGEYIVDVNGVKKTFTMDVDNYISNEDPLK